MFYFSFFSLFFFHYLLDNDLSINLCKSLTVNDLHSAEVCFGGNYRRERCERQMANPFAGVSAGTGRIVEFPSRKAAWEAHGDVLNIAHGRVDFP